MSAALESTVAAARGRLAGGVRELAALAFPVILTNLSATLMMTADAIIVGRLGATALAAVGYGGIWYWTALSGFSGIASGVQTFVAQAYGAGEPRRCGAWAWQGWYAVVPAATLGIALFALAFASLLALLGPDAPLQPLATAYVHARALGVAPFLTATVIAAFLRGYGDTRTPLYAMVAANALNLLLNYGLVYGHLGLPAWGVYGSGCATAVSEWMYAAWLVVAFRRARVSQRFETAPIAPRREAIRRFLQTSAPIGGQWWLDMLAFAVFTTLVARMGTNEMAASQAMISLMHLSFMTIVGVQIAAATLVGQYVGAGDLAGAARSHRSALHFGLGLSALAGAVYLSAPERCLRLFIHDADVLRLGVPLLWVGCLFQFFDALGVIANGALRGAGDTRWPFVVQTGLAWGVFLPCAWLLGHVLDGRLIGTWLGGVVYVAVLGVLLHGRFRSNAWQRMRI